MHRLQNNISNDTVEQITNNNKFNIPIHTCQTKNTKIEEGEIDESEYNINLKNESLFLFNFFNNSFFKTIKFKKLMEIVIFLLMKHHQLVIIWKLKNKNLLFIIYQKLLLLVH